MQVNLYYNKKCEIVKANWKSLRGAIAQLKKINKSCKKLGYETEILIRLPLI